MMCDDLELELRFYYKTDDDAIKGKEELKHVFGKHRDDPDYMVFNRIHNKIRGGRFYSLNKCSNDFMQAYIIKITEILERFEKNFPTKWDRFEINTHVYHRRNNNEL